MHEPYLDALADLFYPRRCAACDRRSSDVLCRICFDALPRIEGPRCERCGLPTAFETYVCDACANVDFGFETAKAPLKYEGTGKEVVHALKYRGYRTVAERVMAPLMVGVLDGEIHFDAVVPVPLHRSRMRRRGFNQAALMAGAVANEINTPLSDRMEAVRKTRDQVELTAQERKTNVSGAFRSREPMHGRILLVDDVFTTGATTSECAETLLHAGASEVHALTFCRTV